MAGSGFEAAAFVLLWMLLYFSEDALSLFELKY